MDAIHVVGAGGIGCALGYALRAAGVPVVFVEVNPAKVAAGQSGGRDRVLAHGRGPLPERLKAPRPQSGRVQALEIGWRQRRPHRHPLLPCR